MLSLRRIWILSLFPLAAIGAEARASGPCIQVPVLDDRCEAWVSTYDNGAASPAAVDSPSAMVVGRNSVFVTGKSGSPAELRYDYATVAFDLASGATRWTARYGSTGGYDDPFDLALSPDSSRLFVTGISAVGLLDSEAATVAYDTATGEQIWAARAGAKSYGWAVAVGPDDDTVYVAANEPNVADVTLIAYDAATGDELWRGRHYGARSLSIPRDIGVAPDGSRVYVTGEAHRSGSMLDYLTVAFDANPEKDGKVLWAARYAGPVGPDLPMALAVDPLGARIYVTGASYGPSDRDGLTVAYDAGSGAERWVARFDGEGFGALNDVAVTPDGSTVLAAGVRQDGGLVIEGNLDQVVLAYDAATGTARWEAFHGTPGFTNERATSIAVAPDGLRAYVAGFSSPRMDYQPSSDLVTQAYDPSTGEQLWVARYNPSSTGLDRAYGGFGLTDVLVGVAPDGRRTFTTGTFEYSGSEEGGYPDMDFGVAAYES